MATKLTDAQVRALKVMPFSYTTWGIALFTTLPEGVRSRETLYALERRGFAKMRRIDRGNVEWRITEAGRQALKEQETTNA